MENINRYQHLHPVGTDPEPQHGQYSPLHFSPEEMRVLRECNSEALWFRSIPFAAVLSSATYYAVSKGYMRSNVRFGAAPKMFAAVMVGYMLGKLSYQEVCVNKLLQLPNSMVGDAIRKRKGLPMQTVLLGPESDSESHDVFTNVPAKPIFDDHKPDERDYNEGLDEFQRVTDSLSEYMEPPTPAGIPAPSYDDRRRLNRVEYSEKLAAKYRRAQHQEGTSAPPQSTLVDTDSSKGRASLPVGHRNQYGDIVYDE